MDDEETCVRAKGLGAQFIALAETKETKSAQCLFLCGGALGDFETSSTSDLFRRRGHCDFQHTILEGGLRLIGHRAFGKRNDPAEASVASFGAVDALTVLPVFTPCTVVSRPE